MTAPRTLCVVYLPSPYEHVWRQAISGAALMAGWTIGKGSDEPVAGSGTSLLVNCDDAAEVAAWDPCDVFILNGDPHLAVGTTMTAFATDFGAAVFFCASRYANAGELQVSRQARVLDQGAMQIEVDGLGEITRTVIETQTPTCPNALAFYSTLPPLIGAKGAWPAELFTYDAAAAKGPLGGTAVDLTGRNRLLQYGPNFKLAPAAWMATVRFAFKTLHGSAELRFNWGHGEKIATQSHVLKADGIYEISLKYEWVEASAAEIQIWLARPAFDGSVEILDCTIEPIAADLDVATPATAGLPSLVEGSSGRG